MDAGALAAAIDDGAPGELESALSAIELQSKDAACRAALAALAGSLARRLQRGSPASLSQLEAPLATRMLDVLATLAQDEGARASALAADAVATMVGCAGAGAPDARLAAVKALLNFTQGECKEDARVWQCIRPLSEIGEPELQRYALMALANLSTGSDAVKAQLLQNQIGRVCARIIGAQDMQLNVATQALRVLMPLSTASCKAELAADEQLVDALAGILRDPAARLRLASLKTPAEKAVAAQAHKASVMLAFNLTGVERELLLERGLGRALVCVVEAESATMYSSAASAQHAEWALKGLYNLGKVSPDCWARVLSADGMLRAASGLLLVSSSPSPDAGAAAEGGAEAAAARTVGVKVLALRGLTRAVQDLSKTPQLAPVLLAGEHGEVLCRALTHVMHHTPEILSSQDLERLQERGESGHSDGRADGEVEEDDDAEGAERGEGGACATREAGGEAAVLSKVLLLVLALAQLSEAGRAWVCERLVDALVQVANSCQFALQGMALGSPLHLARGPQASMPPPLSPPPLPTALPASLTRPVFFLFSSGRQCACSSWP